MEKRGVTAYVIVTDAFLPLVQAQAKARGADPRLVVVNHPVGGLHRDELAARIDQAAESLLEAAGGGTGSARTGDERG
ncbi:MAG: hypothetical protein GEV03_27680 [Streptosporangiales bacterium]|nr:hypothetical protein [Streptosporangiales bacterium]